MTENIIEGGRKDWRAQPGRMTQEEWPRSSWADLTVRGYRSRKVSANLARRSRSQRESVTSSMRRRLTCQEILSQEDSYELADLMRNALRGVTALGAAEICARRPIRL
jgi:hypothetical protein